MCSVKSNADSQMSLKEQPDSSSNDELSWSGSPTTDGGMVLKKGPWTTAEDAILRDFVKKYGEGNWNAVQRNTGLRRCGKSCRLRWANHLRPELKKVAFTQEEEIFIIESHAKIGNKWARMASFLPGRTDNEIKNYWNTRTKRRQRAGLPLYPDNLHQQTSNLNHPIQISGQFYTDGGRENNGIPQGCLLHEMPEFQFDPRSTTTAPPSYPPPFSAIRSGASLKRTREESESAFPAYHDGITTLISTFKEISSIHSESIYQNLRPDYHYDPDPVRRLADALSNGNNPSCSPLPGAVKMELPSLQCPETNHGNWLTTESSRNAMFLPEYASPRSSGLLEALVYESRAMGSGRKPSSVKSSCSSAVSEPIESPTIDLRGAEWEEISDRQSSVSLIDGSEEAMPRWKESPHWADFSRPDVLFDSGMFLRSSQRGEGAWMANDSFIALLSEDLSEELGCAVAPPVDLVPDGVVSMVSMDCGAWRSMPSVCQMPEHH